MAAERKGEGMNEGRMDQQAQGMSDHFVRGSVLVLVDSGMKGGN